MNEGHVLNLSRQGIGIHADNPLKPDMELALFVKLPDLKDHLCIREAHVAWVRDQRFGVALRTMKREDQEQLHHFLWTYPLQHRHARQNGARQGHTRKAC